LDFQTVASVYVVCVANINTCLILNRCAGWWRGYRYYLTCSC